MNTKAKTLNKDSVRLAGQTLKWTGHAVLAPAAAPAAIMCVLAVTFGHFGLGMAQLGHGPVASELRAIVALATIIGMVCGLYTRGFWGLCASVFAGLNLSLVGIVHAYAYPGAEIALAVTLLLSAGGFTAAGVGLWRNQERSTLYNAPTWAFACALPVVAAGFLLDAWAGTAIACLAAAGYFVWIFGAAHFWPGWARERSFAVMVPFVTPAFLASVSRKFLTHRGSVSKPAQTRPARQAHAAKSGTPNSAPRGELDVEPVTQVDCPVPCSVPDRNFKTLIGMETLKKRLIGASEEIFNYWRRPEAERNNDPLPPRNGILLHGEPGNGKSAVAEALAGELGVPFMAFTQGDIASKWVNQTTEQLVAVFKAAEQIPFSILFVDEIDSLLAQRSAAAAQSGAGESNKLVNAFLRLAEELRRYPVMLIGATNHLEMLDDAAIREGRFDFKIQVPPPDREARKGLIDQLGTFCGREITIDQDDLSLILDSTEGLAATRILALLRELAMEIRREPASEGPRVVTYQDFSAALRAIRGQMGLRLPENTPGLDEVILSQETRGSLESLVWRIAHPRETEAGGGTIPTGVLFGGPPGTGKTLVARALAKETDWNFIPTSGAEIARNPTGVADLIARAKAARPVIVFIDEADDILANRANYAATPVLNEFLQAIDGSAGRLRNVLFVAASNRVEAMDPAALRGGRFSEKLEFPLPDIEMATRFIELWLGRSRAIFALPALEIAKLLDGISYANIEAILQAAANQAVCRVGDNQVNDQDLALAKRKVVGR